MAADGGDLTGGPTPPQRNRRRDTRMVFTGVVAVLLVWFALANLQDVTINFWLAKARAPAIVVVVIAGVLGALIGRLFGRWRRRAARSARRGGTADHLDDLG